MQRTGWLAAIAVAVWCASAADLAHAQVFVRGGFTGTSLCVGGGGFTSGVIGTGFGCGPRWAGGWGGGFAPVGIGPGWGGWGGCAPVWGGGFRRWNTTVIVGGNPCWVGGWGGGWAGGGWWGPWGPPPVVLPAETLYGPLAVRRFMGIDPPLVSPYVGGFSPYTSPLYAPPVWGGVPLGVGLPAGGGVPVIGVAAQAPAGPVAPLQPFAPAAIAPEAPPVWRTSNAQSRGRAWTFIGHGDQHFQTQRFSQALARYRSAANAAPDLHQPYLRQAAARYAMGQYDQAIQALRRSLEIAPQGAALDFSMLKLYGNNHIARESHLERLAEQAAVQGDNPDLLMLLGAVLLMQEQPDRARLFLERAETLAQGERFHVGRLLLAARDER